MLKRGAAYSYAIFATPPSQSSRPRAAAWLFVLIIGRQSRTENIVETACRMSDLNQLDETIDFKVAL